MTIQEILRYAIKRWRLSNVSEIYVNKTRAVYQVEAEAYGSCIMKINLNSDTLNNEAEMLRQLNGLGSCKLYEFDSDRSILLEERIIPGTVLRKEEDPKIRILHFVELFQKIHRKAENNRTFPTYLDWLNNAVHYMEEDHPQSDMTKAIQLAMCIGEAMFDKYGDRVLLHGDFHHDNVLRNSDGEYQMIDPKGVIGPEIFDLPRFIMNELDPDLNITGKQHIDNIIDLITEKLRYPREDIGQLFYMEVVLGNCWCIEDGEEPDRSDLEIASQVLKESR